VTLVDERTSRAPSGIPKALFPEARRRRRQIRLSAGIIVVVFALATGGIAYGLAGHSAPPRAPLPPPVSSAPSQIAPTVVVQSTERAESAQESWRSIDGAPGCYPTLTGKGIINLVRPSAAVTVTESGCLPGGPAGASQYHVVQVGGSVFQTRQPHEADNFSGKTWLKVPSSAMDLAHLASDEPLLVLNAVQGQLQRTGTAYIRGVATTEYRGSATLQSLQTATHFVNYGPFGTPDPPLNRIPVRINVWVDGSNRLRQISTWQPQYVLYFTDGSSEGGPYLVAPTTGTPKGPPNQRGYEATTLDLWRFGTTAGISAPPARTVAQPKQ
jgi:hypothetical protein